MSSVSLYKEEFVFVLFCYVFTLTVPKEDGKSMYNLIRVTNKWDEEESLIMSPYAS